MVGQETGMHIYSRETAKWNCIHSNIGVKNHGTVITDAYIDVTVKNSFLLSAVLFIYEIKVPDLQKFTLNHS